MTVQPWRARCAAIHRSAIAEGFDITRLVRTASLPDPHERHVGRTIHALVPSRMTEGRIDDVAVPLIRGDWTAPTELIEARTLARRQVLAELIGHDGDLDTQMAIMVVAFVHTHVTMANRRRHAWPVAACVALVDAAMSHMAEKGIEIMLPVEGAYALMGSSHMCRAAPERLCDDEQLLDLSVGRHIAMSFRDTTLLSISIEHGGEVPVAPAAANTRSLLLLGKDSLQGMIVNEGVDTVCERYGMKPKDLTQICRRRGIDLNLIAA